MRLGVLDIGSNTAHLLVVDAHGGAAPMPAHFVKEPLQLAEHLDAEGAVTADGVEALVRFVSQALKAAEDKGCEEILAFATSAVRDAANSDEVLTRVQDQTGVTVEVLPGEDEARLTFLAVRRWFGWSAGRLAVFDIGGGSLEMAVGADESPEVAVSLPLGAGRLTREWLADGTTEAAVHVLRKEIRVNVARQAGALLKGGPADLSAATSKTLRSLARICGAPASAEGLRVRRVLRADALTEALPRLLAASAEELGRLPGVSPSRAHQLKAGALVAEAVLDLFELEQLEICPWALREGIILERLDRISVRGGPGH
jgi:exopolyphosphatase/guanosine-5'-triphosphate,3'-diphosphate pyrophosphatase